MDNPCPLICPFDDFDEFAESLRGYGLDFRQLKRGQFAAASQQVVADSVMVSLLSGTQRMEVKGIPPPGVRTFGIPTEKCLPFTWRYQHSDGNSIQLYRDTTEVELVTQPFFEAIDLSIEEDALNRHCQTLGLPELDVIIGDNEMLVCHPDSMLTLRKALRHVCLILGNDPSRMKTMGMQQAIEIELPHLLLSALYMGKSQALIPERCATPDKRRRALKKAVAYIRDLSDTSITLNDLCEETGVSARTLQYAFQDHFNLSPKAYLRTQRLYKVRKELLTSNPGDAIVSKIAYQSGFNHLGQFASDYRRLFRELPSVTLTRSKS